jgi:mono/diheme cytochrome c family protein
LDTTRTVRTVDTTTNVNAPAARRGRGCGCWIAVLVVLLLGGAITAYFGATFALRQETVLEPEAALADLGKRWVMVPGEFTDWQMPASARTEQAVAGGKDLFGAECALCHGQNGKGDGSFGVTMFPPAADLTRERTQSKTDGQLFYLIAHGLNYTGMPAWGTDFGGANSQEDIWKLVAYIRSIRGQ